ASAEAGDANSQDWQRVAQQLDQVSLEDGEKVVAQIYQVACLPDGVELFTSEAQISHEGTLGPWLSCGSFSWRRSDVRPPNRRRAGWFAWLASPSLRANPSVAWSGPCGNSLAPGKASSGWSD